MFAVHRQPRGFAETGAGWLCGCGAFVCAAVARRGAVRRGTAVARRVVGGAERMTNPSESTPKKPLMRSPSKASKLSREHTRTSVRV